MEGYKVRRDTLIIFLINNLSGMYFSLIYAYSLFYVWFGTSINQKNSFKVSLLIFLPRHASLENRKVGKNYPGGFSMLSSSVTILYFEMFGIEIIALGILEI